MALGKIQSKVKSFFHSNLHKRRRPSSISSECENKKPKNESTLTVYNDDGGSGFNQQLTSSFFRDLPIEIRKMIYGLVWLGQWDHKYHSRGRHLHFQNGHWTNTRCVMYEDDENLDLIQRNMDTIHNSGKGDLMMWQKRLASTWGSRHWRCEERLQYGRQKSVDRTNFIGMMLVCKRMFPEVVESIFESHQFLFNDFFSAHRFFVYSPSPYASHIRHLDLTLSLPFHEYAPFIVDQPKSRVRELWEALGDISCLHSLRVSLDIYDRGPWRKIPECGVTAQLKDLRVLRDFTVELPPSLPIKTQLPNMQNIDAEDVAFEVVRRNPLRYWQFCPGEVERFRWETHTKGEQSHCYINLIRDPSYVRNPYMLEFF
ncbi:hypothetical protein F4820DRAFT_422716 [Hypoxylon rubiginosum]|uniref:Uncharacterized protein n=1 Tax=Hypoxylon rubiginosum TaxID=110542 RepID=A0ACB9YZ11_9PEZI|nr:hypothetical protein F4820DRAFT_422716 [Hypoxylon rubiginosum]